MQAATRRTILGILTIALVPVLNGQSGAPRQPLARIGDRAIYEEDLLPLVSAQLFQLKNQEYELKSKALTNLINQTLLKEEAKGTGLSPQAFLMEKVDRNVRPPSAEEVEAYYQAHKDPLNRPFEQIKAQLEQTVKGLKLQQARDEYFAALQRKAGVSILFSRPRVEIVTDPSRTRGNQDALVTIVEFADFECPYSQQAEPALRAVLEEYKGKVRFAFLDFPLKAIHPLAEQAAEASRCAGEQGRFWEYHDRLLGKDARLDPEGLREHARILGLDMERFRGCLESGKFAASVASDVVAGYKSGVPATPTFYVNGTALVGIQSASDLKKAVESELAVAVSRKP